MTINALRALFSDVPGFSLNEWDTLYRFVRAWRPERCLDIGFGNGVSTVCIASAAREASSKCAIVAVDSILSKHRSPNVEALRKRAGLDDGSMSVSFVDSYCNSAFIELLDIDSHFDLIHIDGEKSRCSMGFTVLLAQRVLNDNGWLVITGADHGQLQPWLADPALLKKPPTDQITRQVDKVFELLICRDRRFNVCRRRGGRYFAQLAKDPSMGIISAESKMEMSYLLDRAYRDPDFRFDLLWDVRKVMAAEGATTNRLLGAVRFVDNNEDVVLGREYDVQHDVYVLGTPSWSSPLNRAELQEMLNVE